MISWTGKKSSNKGGKTLATTLASDGTPLRILHGITKQEGYEQVNKSSVTMVGVRETSE